MWSEAEHRRETRARGEAGIPLTQLEHFSRKNAQTWLKTQADIGNIRETFIFNKLLNSGLEIFSPPNADFELAEYLIEVVGKNKPANSRESRLVIAADDIETGHSNKIPLGLFGLLYWTKIINRKARNGHTVWFYQVVRFLLHNLGLGKPSRYGRYDPIADLQSVWQNHPRSTSQPVHP